MKDIVIPQPLQIVVDDTGWFCGDDDRKSGGASRTGMGRRHGYRDYVALHELGKGIGQSIVCGFCLSEWDPDNRLRKFPQISKYGENWDNASYIDMDEAKKCAEFINESPFIDVALHGMGHGYYSEENTYTDASDFYIVRQGGKVEMTDENYIKGIVDNFLGILKYYGINKEVTTMIPPAGVYRFNELSRVLAGCGIKYVSAGFWEVICDNGEVLEDVAVENGILTMNRYRPEANNWLVRNINYDNVAERVFSFGSHWPNWLHDDPERNMEVVESAIKYFNRCAEQQGTVISRDMGFAVTQTMFYKHAKITENQNGETVIDVSCVPKHDSMRDFFCINSIRPIAEIEGGEITEFARKKDFITYEIKPKSDFIILK
ncbi:MAG: hypothetical protein IKU45_05230 [Clostridia bacterium]|nr:hypothetical protein [Clostridia bacterium]